MRPTRTIPETIREETTAKIAAIQDVPTIRDAEGERRAAAVLAQAKDALKKIEAKRKSFVQPLNDHVKNINAEFRSLAAPLEAAIERLTSAILTYRESPAYRDVIAYRDAITEEAKSAVRSGDIGALGRLATVKTNLDEVAPKVVQTEAGSVGTRKTWAWEIADPDLIPRAYLMPDEKKIAAAVRSGITIPGIHARQVESLVTRT